MTQPTADSPANAEAEAPVPPTPVDLLKNMPPEIGGPTGPEPTRYGDWEQKGRCTDF